MPHLRYFNEQVISVLMRRFLHSCRKSTMYVIYSTYTTPHLLLYIIYSIYITPQVLLYKSYTQYILHLKYYYKCHIRNISYTSGIQIDLALWQLYGLSTEKQTSITSWVIEIEDLKKNIQDKCKFQDFLKGKLSSPPQSRRLVVFDHEKSPGNISREKEFNT